MIICSVSECDDNNKVSIGNALDQIKIFNIIKLNIYNHLSAIASFLPFIKTLL